MNKKRLLTVFIILLLLVGGWYAYLHLYLPNQSNNNNTELDALINQTTGSSLTSTGATIDVNASSDGTPQYEGGGTYADFSDDAARMALEQ